ncbi:MAG: acetyltransferase [Leadbetterella sp.]
MENPVIIFGASQLGKLAMDAFSSNDVLIYGFLDENKELHNSEISEIMILGDVFDDGFLKFIGNKTEAFVAVEDKALKKKIVEMLQSRRKVMPVNVIHARSIVSDDAVLGHGILVGPGAIVNSGVNLGNFSTILSGAIVDVDSTIGEFVEVGSGAVLNAQVEVGEGAFIGSGCMIVSGIKIGKNSRIGAGSVVIDHVKDGETVFGNPAKPLQK